MKFSPAISSELEYKYDHTSAMNQKFVLGTKQQQLTGTQKNVQSRFLQNFDGFSGVGPSDGRGSSHLPAKLRLRPLACQITDQGGSRNIVS